MVEFAFVPGGSGVLRASPLQAFAFDIPCLPPPTPAPGSRDLQVGVDNPHGRTLMGGLVGAYCLAGFLAMGAAVLQLRHDPSQLKVGGDHSSRCPAMCRAIAAYGIQAGRSSRCAPAWLQQRCLKSTNCMRCCAPPRRCIARRTASASPTSGGAPSCRAGRWEGEKRDEGGILLDSWYYHVMVVSCMENGMHR